MEASVKPLSPTLHPVISHWKQEFTLVWGIYTVEIDQPTNLAFCYRELPAAKHLPYAVTNRVLEMENIAK